MSVWSVVILLMIGAFIHDSCALKCYNCSSPAGGSCDDPLDIDKTPHITCPDEADGCITLKSKLFLDGTQHNVLQLKFITVQLSGGLAQWDTGKFPGGPPKQRVPECIYNFIS